MVGRRKRPGLQLTRRRAATGGAWGLGVVSESVAYGFLVASYRRRMGLVAVREMARHRYRQSQFVGLTRLQLDEIGRERQVQRQGAQRAEARAELSVELAQARILPAYELGR